MVRFEIFCTERRRTSEPQATDKSSEEEKSKNLCDKTRLLTISTQSLGDFSTSTKRGLRKQRYIENEADIKTFSNQSDEGRDVRGEKSPKTRATPKVVHKLCRAERCETSNFHCSQLISY